MERLSVILKCMWINIQTIHLYFFIKISKSYFFSVFVYLVIYLFRLISEMAARVLRNRLLIFKKNFQFSQNTLFYVAKVAGNIITLLEFIDKTSLTNVSASNNQVSKVVILHQQNYCNNFTWTATLLDAVQLEVCVKPKCSQEMAISHS